MEDVLLVLDYTCTPKEMSEAHGLGLQQTVGAGSRAKAIVALSVFLALALSRFWRIFEEMSPTERKVWTCIFLSVWIVLFIALKKRNRSAKKLHVQIFPSQITVETSGTKTRTPWAAFANALESKSVILLAFRSGKLFYVIPKRVLPTAEWAEWLIASVKQAAARPCEKTAKKNTDQTANPKIAIDFHLRFRNCLDYSLACWTTRGLILFFFAIMAAAMVKASSEMVAHPVIPAWEAMLLTVGFSSILAIPMMVMIVAMRLWSRHRSWRSNIELNEEEIFENSERGETRSTWGSFRWYKETPWSFLIWNNKPKCWLMFPKSAFQSRNDVFACRELIASKLKKSTWFIGG